MTEQTIDVTPNEVGTDPTKVVVKNDPNDVQSFVDSRVEKIKVLHKQTLENVIEIGRLLNQIREVAPKNTYIKVIKEEIGLNKQSAANYTNLANLWDNHPEYRDGIQKMALNGAYLLAKTTVDEDTRKLILDMASEDDPLNREEVEEVTQVVRDYRKFNVSEYIDELDNDAAILLYDCEIAEDKDELRRLSKLSKKSQRIVARYISNGEADNIRDALRIEKQKKDEEKKQSSSSPPRPSSSSTQKTLKDDEPSNEPSSKESQEDYEPQQAEEPQQELIQVEYSAKTKIEDLNVGWENVVDHIDEESLDLMFVEAPLKHQFLIDGGFNRISALADQILKPGGVLLTTVGHKSSMFIGEELRPIEPLHLLVLRRQPGNSRSIVGINITCASVILAMAYKKPFNAPSSMVVDLQTVEGFDEVHSGLEKGIENFLTHLLEPDSDMLHLVCSKKENFKLEEGIKDIAERIEVNKLYLGS